MTVIRQRPRAATFRRGYIWGYPTQTKIKNAEILGDLSLISVPSRGANRFKYLRAYAALGTSFSVAGS